MKKRRYKVWVFFGLRAVIQSVAYFFVPGCDWELICISFLKVVQTGGCLKKSWVNFGPVHRTEPWNFSLFLVTL